MLQIALVPDEHDDDVRVRVVAELLEPPRHVHVRRVLRDVVHEERTDCPAVVPVNGNRIASSDDRGNEGETSRRACLRGGNRTITFLSSYDHG